MLLKTSSKTALARAHGGVNAVYLRPEQAGVTRVIHVYTPTVVYETLRRVHADVRSQAMSLDEGEARVRELIAPYCPLQFHPSTDEIVIEHCPSTQVLTPRESL